MNGATGTSSGPAPDGPARQGPASSAAAQGQGQGHGQGQPGGTGALLAGLGVVVNVCAVATVVPLRVARRKLEAMDFEN